jgi:predicted RNA-binding Zn ribbon-like protein
MRIVEAHPIELVLPGEPTPIRLMNTTWVDEQETFDALGGLSDLRAFLVAIGSTVPTDLGVEDLISLHQLRTALRTLAQTSGTSGEECSAVETLNAALALAPAADVLATSSEGWILTRVEETSFDACLSRLAREGAAALADRSRPLRVCHAPGCGLYFVQSHSRRRWCSPGCGDRVRAARYYQRHRRSAGT